MLVATTTTTTTTSILAGAGCSDTPVDEFAEDEDSGPKPIHVEAIQVTPQEFVYFVALTGQLNAEHSVLLKPEYEGIVESIDVVEGGLVKEGDVLFRMRDGEQKARLREARAELGLARDVRQHRVDAVHRGSRNQADDSQGFLLGELPELLHAGSFIRAAPLTTKIVAATPTTVKGMPSAWSPRRSFPRPNRHP